MSAPTSDAARHSWLDLPEPDTNVSDQVIAWFKSNGREFPWRRTRDPWMTLCAELMLQRTRATQVEPVYREFAGSYSGPEDVVKAGLDKVEEIFGRLGLRWRAEYFYSLQEQLVECYNGEVPTREDELRSLPGVGQYGASAVRVFAYGEQETVLDSNVLRIMGRFYGIAFPDHARRSQRVKRWLSQMAPESPSEARSFNWGLIDLGAEVCKPHDPDCVDCPIRGNCWYGQRV